MNSTAGFLARVWADSRRPLPQPGDGTLTGIPPERPETAIPRVDTRAGARTESELNASGNRHDTDASRPGHGDHIAADLLASPSRDAERQAASDRPTPPRETAPGSMSPRPQAVEDGASGDPVPQRFGTLVFSRRRTGGIRPVGPGPSIPRPVVQAVSETAARSPQESVSADPGAIAPVAEPPEPSPVPPAPVESVLETDREGDIAVARATEPDPSHEYDRRRAPPEAERRRTAPPRLHIGEVRIRVEEEPGRAAPDRRRGRVTKSDSQRLIRSL